MRKYLLLVFIHLHLVGYAQQAAVTTPTIKLRCPASNHKEPLYILDGLVVDLKVTGKLDPNDIESVEVLKPSNKTAAIYGSASASGVIIITTKNKPMQLTLADEKDGEPIPAVTARFANGKDTFYLVSDSNGVIRSNLIKGKVQYEVMLSSIGYAKKEFGWVTFADNNEFYWTMSRQAVTLSPVIVIGYPPCVCKRYTYCTRHYFPDRFISKSIKGVDHTGEDFLKAYPNPVQRGNRFFIEIDHPVTESVSIRILTLDGRPVLTNSSNVFNGMNRVSINTSAGWSAGIYFIQLLNKDGKVQLQQRILIQ